MTTSYVRNQRGANPVDIARNRTPHWPRESPSVYFASRNGLAAAVLDWAVFATAITGQLQRLDVFARIPNRAFRGGRVLRMSALVAAMSWCRLRDAVG